MKRLGYKTRLLLWHAAVITAILAVAALSVDWIVQRIVLDEVDASLLHAAETEAGEIAEEGEVDHVHAPTLRRVHGLVWSFNPVVQIVDLDGRVTALGPGLTTDRGLPVSAPMLARVRRGKVFFQTTSALDAPDVRVVAIPVSARGRPYAVEVAQPLREARRLLARLRWVLVGMCAGVLAAMLGTDLLLARRGLRPIDAIVRQARRIRDSNLAERLPHPEVPGELARLVDTLNEMLARLHDSFQAQRRFTADAAHELRSPLTRLRTEIEVALRRPRVAEEYRRVLETGLDELERLARLTHDLLTLARLDAGEGHEVPLVPAPLAPLLAAVRERFLRAAEARGVEIVLAPLPPIVVRALPAVVEIVLANVLDNAVKFSPPGGLVTVGATESGDDAVVTIADRGPGIPAEELPRVFERFFRGRAPRATTVSGVGLGLAIARTLAERQHGSIAIASEPGHGTTVTVRFPLASARAERLATR